MAVVESKAWPPPDLHEDVPLTYPALFLKYASQTPPYVPGVLTTSNPNEAVSYGSLMWHVCQLALVLRKEHGVKDGKSVVILMEKSNRYVHVCYKLIEKQKQQQQKKKINSHLSSS